MKTLKIFLSETIRHRALIFGMWYHLVDFYQACSNYAPEVKWHRSWGHIFYIGLYMDEREKIFYSKTIRTRALIFGM